MRPDRPNGPDWLRLTRGTIFNAWSDLEWVNEGAAVRVSLVGFSRPAHKQPVVLNGQPVTTIYADLTYSDLGNAGNGADLTQAKSLRENGNTIFMGASKKGSLDIPGKLARQWLVLPNPHGRPNSDVLRPLWNALDVTRRPRDQWVIDFGTEANEVKAALFERPFQYALEHVKPERSKNNREAYRDNWWRFAESRPGMRSALGGVSRFIVTPAVAKHRLFIWLHRTLLPDQALLYTQKSMNCGLCGPVPVLKIAPATRPPPASRLSRSHLV